MKQALLKFYFLFAVMMFACTVAFAQKNFEGKIIYEFTDTTILKSRTEIYFGKQKLAIKENSSLGAKSLLTTTSLSEKRITDFEKGITYHVDENDRTYYEEQLQRRGIDTTEIFKPFPLKNKKILNYTCSAYQSANSSDTTENDLMAPLQICMWYADSLYYIIDEKYRNIHGLEKATNGVNIGMGLEIITGYPGKIEKMIIEPILIAAGQIPDSVFSIPKDYKKKTEKEFYEKIFSQFVVTKPPSTSVTVAAPSSVSTKMDPDKSIVISLEKEGKVFLTMGKKIKKIEILNDINKTKALNLSSSEIQKLNDIPQIAVPLAKLKTMFSDTFTITPEQMEGIPVKDSTTNELTDWIRSIINVYQDEDTIKLEEMILIKGDPNALYPDFKNIKYALKKNGLYRFRIITNSN